MSTSREIRLGKVTGLSSYELAVQSGMFTGSLSDYLNKEQQYYNDMVTYGDQLLANINTLVRPATYNVTDSIPAATGTIPTATETTVYTYQFTTDAFASISAFAILSSTASIANGYIKMYLNDNLVAASGISNNILSANANLMVSLNDELTVVIYHDSGLSRTITDSSIQINYTERS